MFKVCIKDWPMANIHDSWIFKYKYAWKHNCLIKQLFIVHKLFWVKSKFKPVQDPNLANNIILFKRYKDYSKD